MNIKNIVIILVVILLLGGGGYFLSQRESAPTPTAMQPSTERQEPAGMSIQELLGLNKTQTCTYSFTDDKAVTSQGTVFIAEGKVRADFAVAGTEGTKNYTGSMINDGKYLYTWSSATKQGMKMALSADMMRQIEDAQLNPGQYMDLNKKLDYKCEDWQADATMFTPPTEINFMDFSAQLKQIEGMKKNVDAMKQAPCAACDNLQGSAKDSCKAALQCP